MKPAKLRSPHATLLLLGAITVIGVTPLHSADSPKLPAQAPAGKVYQYVAKTAAPARRQGAVTAAGIVWQCRADQCTTAGPWPVPGVEACRALAFQVGQVKQYGHAARQLSAAELARCNGGATVTAKAKPPVALPKAGANVAPKSMPAAKLDPDVAASLGSSGHAAGPRGPGGASAAAPVLNPSAAANASGAGRAAYPLPGTAGMAATPGAGGLPGSGSGGGGRSATPEMIEEIRTAAAGIASRPEITGVSGNVEDGYCSRGSFTVTGRRFGASQGGRKVVLARRDVAVAQASVQSWSDTHIEASFMGQPGLVAGTSYNVGIQDERGRWVSNYTHQVRKCPENLEISGTIRIENCAAGASNVVVELLDMYTARRLPVAGVEGNDFLLRYRASNLLPRTYTIRPSLTGIECRGGSWTPENAHVVVSYRQPSITRDLEFRVPARTLPLPLRTVARLVQDAFQGLEVHLNNFDPATGGERVNDSFVRLPERLGGGEWRLGLLPARTGPRTYYVNDINLRSVAVNPSATGLRVQLDFETENNAGRFELVGVCRDDAGCIAGAPDVDLSLRVYIDLTLARHFVSGTGYTLSFSDLRVTAEPTTRIDGACQLNWCVMVGAPLPIQECIVDVCDIATNYKSLIRRVVEDSIRSALDTREVRDRIGNGIRPELDALRIGTLTSVRVEGGNLILGYLDDAR